MSTLDRPPALWHSTLDEWSTTPVSIATLEKPETGALALPAIAWKLWLYTNYDCNLACKYCVARSGPNVPRRALPTPVIRQLADEATALHFSHLFLTGGEPFLLPDIYETLAYSSSRLPTTVLTNATLLHDKQLDKLDAIRNEQLIVQVSLDGPNPETHDTYRGRGTWVRTIAGLQRLLQRGYRVRIGTTETPTNTAHMVALRSFLDRLGIRADDHFVRPLARRGFSKAGIELGMDDLIPELTVNVDGVYWHPLSTDRDMQIAKSPLPLQASLERVYELLADPDRASKPRCTFT